MERESLLQIFQPHDFVNQNFLDLYHLYDNLSCTPFQAGIGIHCEDPDQYLMDAWHVITPDTMRRHLDWKNRRRTQFISLYGNEATAIRERQRRCSQLWVPGVGQRELTSIRIAHIRLPSNTKVWAFSRVEMLHMMGTFGSEVRSELFTVLGVDEWFVWGAISANLIVNRHQL
ncbi:hypothetical protein BAUCODRAFT_121743 [Baudoinia panamericana UAMH 10762]|uniref:DUF7587 domain-containing protein n=1 Tax=Baudoinia panamericana (strain UAMH 10762) TaxID=717646 RepID=M2LS04_BAUPA|nr:uncharacterized protein BAUCODRAFT_121743 [Baudoinia panamericana UAMH 10762]EMC97247.1 hypothetical protein BAUCODRAFT_121743 [Baudoinia panamericana UAMH 10762]